MVIKNVLFRSLINVTVWLHKNLTFKKELEMVFGKAGTRRNSGAQEEKGIFQVTKLKWKEHTQTNMNN